MYSPTCIIIANIRSAFPVRAYGDINGTVEHPYNQSSHFIATCILFYLFITLSGLLTAVMEAETALMAVMKLDVSFITYIPMFQYSMFWRTNAFSQRVRIHGHTIVIIGDVYCWLQLQK